MTDYDVIIVGAGFAGIIAARNLGEAGHSTLVVEARDRLGGRTWYKAFGTTNNKLEFGGTWVVPETQPEIKKLMDRYGLELVESPIPQKFGFSIGGVKGDWALPVPIEEWQQLERAVNHINTNAARIKFGVEPLHQDGLEDLDITFEEFIDQLNPPRATREYLLAWGSALFGLESPKVSALHVLSWVAAMGNSALNILNGMVNKFKHGTAAAIEALAGDVKGEIRLSTMAQVIEQKSDSVAVTLCDGSTVTGRAVVVATPINTWDSIEFKPPLKDSHKAMAEEKQGGESTKIWALVKDMPENYYAVGYDTKINWMATEYQVPEGNLIVGFGCHPERLDVDDPESIRAAVHEFLPDANIIEVDAHNWNTDEFSQGTWMAYKAGQIVKHARAIQEPFGRIAFAGSDLASGWAGWMDGALESGERAAGQIEAILKS